MKFQQCIYIYSADLVDHVISHASTCAFAFLVLGHDARGVWRFAHVIDLHLVFDGVWWSGEASAFRSQASVESSREGWRSWWTTVLTKLL